MKRKILILMSGFLILFLATPIFEINPNIEPSEVTMVMEEEVPLGAPKIAQTLFNSGYGVLWTKDPAPESNILNGMIQDEAAATLSIIGNTTGDTNLVGLTRQEAEKIIGAPAASYNNTVISAMSSANKAYYQVEQDLLILYFDVKANSKVLFALRMNASLAKSTRFMTGFNLDPSNIPDNEAMTLLLLNSVRQTYGKGPLAAHDVLMAVAGAHSQSMVDNNYFSHTNPANQGPKERIKAAGITYKNYGEALTAGTWTPMDAITSWMNSPPHRDIILGDFNAAGIGIATGNADYGIYYTLKVITTK